MSLYRLQSEPGDLRAPALVVAFDGWVDAGGAASGAAAHLARDAETLGVFDSDELLDYRARRPVLDVVDGEIQKLAWQEIELKLLRADSRDVLVLSGPEPDLKWKRFAGDVLELALRLGAVEVTALGAIPAAVPHTHPVPLVATASPRERLGPEDRRPEGILRVPAAALSVVQARFIEHGIPTAGFFAQIPHYVSAVYIGGVIALVERLARHLKIDMPLGDLPVQAQQQRVELDAIVAERPEIKEHLARLEELVAEPDLGGQQPIPSGEDIAAEIERYLRRARGEGQ